MSVVKLRKPPGPFENVDRASVDAIRDISALGLWLYLRCKPEGWIVREAQVRDHFGIGRDKYRACVRRLCELGAMEDKRIQGDQGRIIGRELVVNYAVTDSAALGVDRAPENPSHGDSNDKGSDRKPEIPAHGVDRAPEKPVTRRKPSDGKSAPLENSNETREQGLAREQTTSVIGPDPFEVFWDAYPRKKAKQDARRAWAKLKPDVIDAVLRDVPRRATQDRGWLEGYIPNPATYLNGERWTDEIEIRGQSNDTNRKPNQAPRTAAERGEAFGAECWGRIYAQREADADVD